MIKESVFRGSLDNKMAARKASIWALFTQCSPYEYLQFTQATPTGKKTYKWFFKCSMCIYDYVDYTYLQFNGLWLDRAQAGGNIDLLSSQIENINRICSELNLERGRLNKTKWPRQIRELILESVWKKEKKICDWKYIFRSLEEKKNG